MLTRLPLPPFTETTAQKKVKMMEDDWNLQCPKRISLAYAAEATWQFGNTTLQGFHGIFSYLSLTLPIPGLKVKKCMSVHISKRIVADFSYSYQDLFGQLQTGQGSESYEFDTEGKILKQVTTLARKDHTQTDEFASHYRTFSN